MTERDELQQSWIANADAWRDAVREQRIASRKLVTDAAIVDAVIRQRPDTVLDLGCGEGWLARKLASYGLLVTGVDASQPLIAAANDLGGATFIAASYSDITANPSLLGETQFDVAVANFSLLDDDPAAVLRALPASALIVQTIHPVFASDGRYEDGWRTETFAAFEGESWQPMPWYFRTLSSWLRAIAEAGYRLAWIEEPLDPARKVPASIIFVCGR